MFGGPIAELRWSESTSAAWSTVLLREDPRQTVLVVQPQRDLSVAVFEKVVSRLPIYERNRLASLRRWPDRLNSAIGWHLLHRLADQRDLSVNRDRHGRPRTDPPFDIGLSHSDRWTAVVLSRCGRVGIDVEGVRFVSMSLARRCLTSEEMAWLDAVEPGLARSDRFFRIWTAKEAYLKALGVGLSVDPRDVAIDCSSSQPALRGPDAGRWAFTSESPTPGLWMTVCTERTS